MSSGMRVRYGRAWRTVLAAGLAAGVVAGAGACDAAPPGGASTSAAPETSSTTAPPPTPSSSTANAPGQGPSTADTTGQAPAPQPPPMSVPPIDATAAARLSKEHCVAESAVLSPPKATLIRTTNLTARVFGRVDKVSGSPRLGDLAGFTGQAYLTGRGLLSVESDGTLRGRWAGLTVDKATWDETGAVREDVVLGTGFGDARAVGGLLRLQGEPYPAIAVLRTNGRLDLYAVTGNAGGPLSVGRPRTVATGLTSATAVTAFSSSQPGPGPRTVLVLVADAAGFTSYVVNVDNPAAAPPIRRIPGAFPGGVVGLTGGHCVTENTAKARPTGDGIIVAWDASRRGHVYLGNWDSTNGQGSLSYAGTVAVPVSGGTLAP